MLLLCNTMITLKDLDLREEEGRFVKKMKLIYNPNSGDKGFKFELDKCIDIFQRSDYEVHMFKTLSKGDIEEHVKEIQKNEYDAFVVSGGDGTINILVNALMKYNLNDTPMGIIPSGTANDFARHLKLPSNTKKCCEIICENNIQNIDIGHVNDRFFINVCCGGLFSNVSQTVDKNFKDTLGKLAYYIKAIEEFQNFQPMKMRITNSNGTFEDVLSLFLVLNSSGAAGFNDISPKASISDGLFDFIGFKDIKLTDIMGLLIKFFKREYLDDDRILFFRDNYIKVENLSENLKYLETDVDGELGPEMPIEITNLKGALKIFKNKGEFIDEF